MDLRLRTVEDEKADRDAAAALAAVQEFAPGAATELETVHGTTVVEVSTTAAGNVAPDVPIAPGTTAVAEFKTVQTQQFKTVHGTTVVAESPTASAGNVAPVVPIAPGTTAVTSAAGNAAHGSPSSSELDVDFDMFVQSRATPPIALEASLDVWSLADSSSATSQRVAEPPVWTAHGNPAGKSRSCSELEVDFDRFAQSRASPLRALEKSETRPQSVPGKSKTRPFSLKPSIQPRSLYFPGPTETSSLRFPEPTETSSLRFPEPTETSSLYFPGPTETSSLRFPEPTETSSLRFPELSKSSRPRYLPEPSDNHPPSSGESSKPCFPKSAETFRTADVAKLSCGNVAGRGRSCSESEVDFDLFVESRASPRRAPETSKPRPHKSLPEKSKTRPSCFDRTSKTSPQRVPNEPRIRSPSSPKPSTSRSPPVPESLRPRHASMERQENSLKDLQHLKKAKKQSSLLGALSSLHLTGSSSPKKASNSPKKKISWREVLNPVHFYPPESSSPKEAENSPKEAKNSPKEAKNSPKEAKNSPKEAKNSPKEAKNSPKKANKGKYEKF